MWTDRRRRSTHTNSSLWALKVDPSIRIVVNCTFMATVYLFLIYFTDFRNLRTRYVTCLTRMGFWADCLPLWYNSKISSANYFSITTHKDITVFISILAVYNYILDWISNLLTVFPHIWYMLKQKLFLVLFCSVLTAF